MTPIPEEVQPEADLDGVWLQIAGDYVPIVEPRPSYGWAVLMWLAAVLSVILGASAMGTGDAMWGLLAVIFLLVAFALAVLTGQEHLTVPNTQLQHTSMFIGAHEFVVDGIRVPWQAVLDADDGTDVSGKQVFVITLAVPHGQVRVPATGTSRFALHAIREHILGQRDAHRVSESQVRVLRDGAGKLLGRGR